MTVGGLVPAEDRSERFQRALCHEAGTSLLEVVLASAVLLLVFIPTASVVGISQKTITTSRAQAIAEFLAASQIAIDREGANTIQFLPPLAVPGVSASSFASPNCMRTRDQRPGMGGASSWLPCASNSANNASPCSITTGYGTSDTATSESAGSGYFLTGCESVNSLTFYIWQVDGWCVPSTSGSPPPPLGMANLVSYGSLGSQVPSYWVKVLVSWSPGGTPTPPSSNGGVIKASRSIVDTTSIAIPGSMWPLPTSGTCPL